MDLKIAKQITDSIWDGLVHAYSSAEFADAQATLWPRLPDGGKPYLNYLEAMNWTFENSRAEVSCGYYEGGVEINIHMPEEDRNDKIVAAALMKALYYECTIRISGFNGLVCTLNAGQVKSGNFEDGLKYLLSVWSPVETGC